MKNGSLLLLIVLLLIAVVFLYTKSYKVGQPSTEILPTAVSNQKEQKINIDITEPKNGSTTTVANILVKGQTVPNADVIVNEKEFKADTQGNFSTTITLDEGENTIYVAANDENGNFAEKEITVTYNADETF